MQKRKYVITVWCLLLLYTNGVFGKFNFDSQGSSIKINNGAQLVINSPISVFDGTLIKQFGALITGQPVTFTNGIFEDVGNHLLLSAVFDPVGTITLSGNSSFRAEPGKVLQSVMVSGTNNRLEGQPIFGSNLILADGATVLALAVQSAFNQHIVLNGGTIDLEEDCIFSGDKKFSGIGTIRAHGYKIATGGTPFTWSDNLSWEQNPVVELHTCVNLASQSTFKGIATLNGHGNVLELATGGTPGVIKIASGCTLYLTDIVIKGVQSGSFVFEDDTANIIMSNVDIELIGDITTTQGGVFVKGASTWLVKDHNWQFSNLASLTVDGAVLCKDQAGALVIGDVTFGMPESNFLSLVDSGTIRVCSSLGGDDDSDSDHIRDSKLTVLCSQIEVLETCCDELRTSTGELQSQIDELETFIFSRIEILETCCDTVHSELDGLESRVEVLETCCDDLRTSTGELQSQIDAIESRVDGAESCCDELESRVEVLETCCETVNSELDSLESRVEVLETCCDDLRTSTGELQSQIDEIKTSTFDPGMVISRIEILETCCDTVNSELDGLESRVEVLETCCDDLRTSTGELQSQIDAIESRVDGAESCCDDLTSRVEVLETCCDDLRTSTGELQSQIDEIKTSTFDPGMVISRIEILETCCDTVHSELDSLESRVEVLETCCDDLRTSTGELQSQIDAIESRVDSAESCCDELESRVEVLETCCDDLRTSTGELQSQIDAIESRVDGAESCCDELESRVEVLETCCDDLRTSTGELQSQIDAIESRVDSAESCCDELESRVEVLETCCDDLRTSTGELQSQIDAIESRVDSAESCCDELESRVEVLETCCDDLRTSTGELQSQIDAIECPDLISRIEILETCCDALRTSTGELQSQIDVLDDCCDLFVLECCSIDSCEITEVARTTTGQLPHDVETADWSVADRFIAVGLGADSDEDPTDVLKTFSWSGATFIELDSTGLSSNQEVTAVRWHPTKFLLAVGTLNSSGLGAELMIFKVDPMTGLLGSPVSAVNVNTDVYAVAWHPSGDYLAVGRDTTGQELAIYKVNCDGEFVDLANMPVMGDSPILTVSTVPHIIQTKALDWNKSGNYLAVGLGEDTATELDVYSFNAGVPSLVLDAQQELGQTVRAVDWNKRFKDVLAIGLEGNAGNLLRLFVHEPSLLTEKVGAAVPGINDSVRALHWSPDGKCLALGRNDDAQTELRTYEFNNSACSLTQISAFESGESVEAVRWSRSGCRLISGADTHELVGYERLCVLDILSSRIDVLETCCDELRTSTGELQSQIDEIESRVDVVETCCDDLRTSTGELQSQIDEIESRVDILETCCESLQSQIDQLKSCTWIPVCDPSVISRIEILETCCDELRTSTGELQSQIDELCELVACDCSISVSGEFYFDLSMVPEEGHAVIFKFDPCFGCCDAVPKLIFDPEYYGNNGLIQLPPCTRMIFCGEGIVELRDNTEFELMGTRYPEGASEDENNCTDKDRSDWPQIITQNGAVLTVDDTIVQLGVPKARARATIHGVGKVVTRQEGSIVLDKQSQLVFGLDDADALDIHTNFNGAIVTDHPLALITFQKACFDIVFNNYSALSIIRGVVEMNTNNTGFYDFRTGSPVPAEGIINILWFLEGSDLQVLRRGSEIGRLVMAPNRADLSTDFNNKAGFVSGRGCIQYKQFTRNGETLTEDRTYPLGGTVTPGTMFPVATTIGQVSVFDRQIFGGPTRVLTGSLAKAGSIRLSVALMADVVEGANVIYFPGDTLEPQSFITAQAFAAGAPGVTSGNVLFSKAALPNISIGKGLASGTVLAAGSELVNSSLVAQSNLFELVDPMVSIFIGLTLNIDPTRDVVAPEQSQILTTICSLDPARDGQLAAFCPTRDGRIVGLKQDDKEVIYETVGGVLSIISGQNIVDNTVFRIRNCNEDDREEIGR